MRRLLESEPLHAETGPQECTHHCGGQCYDPAARAALDKAVTDARDILRTKPVPIEPRIFIMPSRAEFIDDLHNFRVVDELLFGSTYGAAKDNTIPSIEETIEPSLRELSDAAVFDGNEYIGHLDTGLYRCKKSPNAKPELFFRPNCWPATYGDQSKCHWYKAREQCPSIPDSPLVLAYA